MQGDNTLKRYNIVYSYLLRDVCRETEYLPEAVTHHVLILAMRRMQGDNTCLKRYHIVYSYLLRDVCTV